MSQTFRVLHLRASNFVGGPERQILRYAEFERNGPVSVIVGTFVGADEGGEFLEAARQRGLATLALPAGKAGSLHALRVLRWSLRERQVDLVCTHGYRADVLGTIAAGIQRVPVASFLRGWTRENWKVRSFEALNRALLRLTTRVVCLSETQAKRLSGRGSMREKVRVVVNAIEIRSLSADERSNVRREIRNRFHLPENSLIVTSAGRLSPEKGVIHFIRAIPAIRKQHPEARFLVFGDGALRRELESTTHKLCAEGEVCFAGHVPEFPHLLPGIDVLLNPSLSEEMPNVVLEAMAVGVPVVATDVGGVAEIAGKSGLVLIPPADPEAIAHSVSELLSRPSRAHELGQAGQQRVREAFSPEQQRAQLRNLYEELVPGLAAAYGTTFDSHGRRDDEKEELHPENPSGDRLPFISVVVPVRNEEAHLGSALEELLAQDYPKDRYEILVVDGGSTDGTAAVAEHFAGAAGQQVRLLHNPGRLSSAGRNLGVKASRGEVIVFVDGHCRIPTPRLLLETARTLDKTSADCLCRPQPLASSDNTLLQNVVAHARATALGHGRDSAIFAMDREGFINPTSSGAIYRKSVFECVGLYDERFDACEDVEFNHRVFKAGLRSFSSPSLAVYYRPRATMTGLFKQLVRYGRGRLRFMRKHPDALSISQLVPAAFLAWLMAGGLISLWSFFILEIFLSSLIIYAAVVLAFSALLGFRFGWRHFLLAPAVYLTIHFGLGVGFWTELGKGFLGLLLGDQRRARPALIQQATNSASKDRDPEKLAALEESRVRATKGRP